jgi:NAD(P)-dependent dehydrogenase (short-subunit alcohol dehydrogenase family)
MAIPERKTADGFEMQIGVNHLGHFALVGRLLEKLGRANEPRVVTVSSQYHRAGKIELFDDLFFERRPYHRWVAYQQSKLANLLFAFELARRCGRASSKIRSVAAHPGYAATELQSQGARMGGSRFEGMMMAIGNALIAQSVSAGTWPQLRAATDPSAQNGDYFGPRNLNQIRGPAVRVDASKRAHDQKAAQQLWEKSQELTRVTYPV